MSKHGKTCPFQSANILGNSFCQHHQCFNYRRHRTVSDFGNRQYSAGGSRYIPAEPQSESTAQLTRKAYIQRLRFYASFDNLLTITGYKGMDPEIGSTMGIDKGVYPQARVYTFGLNLTF